MPPISNFVEVRADGNEIPEGMTLNEMLERGWDVSRVMAIRWNSSSRQFERAEKYGLHAIVVPGGNFIAAMINLDNGGATGHLEIIAPDGTTAGRMENRIVHSANIVDGRFAWFEPATEPGIDRFGVVFSSGSGDFRCDVDAGKRRILKVVATR